MSLSLVTQATGKAPPPLCLTAHHDRGCLAAGAAMSLSTLSLNVHTHFTHKIYTSYPKTCQLLSQNLPKVKFSVKQGV